MVPAVQRRDEIVGDHAAAAADADEVRGLLHAREHLRVEEVRGGGNQRQCRHHDVGLADHGRQLVGQSDAAHVVGPFARAVRACAITFMPSAWRALARLRGRCRRGPRPAESCRSVPVAVSPRNCGSSPRRVACRPDRHLQRTRQREHQRDGVLGHHRARNRAHVGHDETRLLEGRLARGTPQRRPTSTATQRTRFAAASTRSSQTTSSPPMMASAFAASLARSAASVDRTRSRRPARRLQALHDLRAPVPLGFCVAITMRFGALPARHVAQRRGRSR